SRIAQSFEGFPTRLGSRLYRHENCTSTPAAIWPHARRNFMTKRITTLLAILAAVAFAVACAQTDAGITGKVKSKLAADDTVKAYQIDVDTKDKVVTLSGNVDSQAATDQAVKIARETNGVKDVQRKLTISEKAEKKAEKKGY